MLRVFFSRVRATFRQPRLNDELDDELREHLALLQERFVRNGMDPSEAFYAARRQFGGVTQVKEALMERRALSTGSCSMDNIARVIRHAARRLWRAPLVSAASILTLAIGIGACALMMSVISTVLLKPLPYRDPRSNRHELGLVSERQSWIPRTAGAWHRVQHHARQHASIRVARRISRRLV
jgi:hypothetical protein